MTNADFRKIIVNRINTFRGRSAWARGVCKYALELAEEFDFDALGKKSLYYIMLNGSRNWREYSYDGKALIHERDIAARLLPPSVLKLKDNGRLPANSRETWLDVQARALDQACGLVMIAIYEEFYDGLGKEWVPYVQQTD